jgi:hypothetical protein
VVPIAIAEEHIVAVPFIDAEVASSCRSWFTRASSSPISSLQACDACLPRTRVAWRAFRWARWST